ncbi:GPP34 family phosphoprotein [Streptomyces sp. NPDC048248]|uniref:GOLPH3/VPS74 family protein n=1 Tax=Streptomyces sp. NPDC048248 TaxID=3365523 RepID=UPI0037104B3E
MTTPRDLMIISMDAAPDHPVEQGNLSLALAGAEVIDLLTAQAVELDDDLIVPGYRPTLSDRLLDEAASSLVRETPYESLDDWLWRRGRGLSSAYLAALEGEGRLTRQRHRWMPFRASQTLVDSLEHRQAEDRWTSNEPVLATLASDLGIRGKRPEDAPNVDDEAVATVLDAVHDALTELEAERQRRAIEEAAFDNVWRGE